MAKEWGSVAAAVVVVVAVRWCGVAPGLSCCLSGGSVTTSHKVCLCHRHSPANINPINNVLNTEKPPLRNKYKIVASSEQPTVTQGSTWLCGLWLCNCNKQELSSEVFWAGWAVRNMICLTPPLLPSFPPRHLTCYFWVSGCQLGVSTSQMLLNKWRLISVPAVSLIPLGAWLGWVEFFPCEKTLIRSTGSGPSRGAGDIIDNDDQADDNEQRSWMMMMMMMI